MMVTSYLLGQKHYPVPYARKKILAYITVCLLLFGLHRAFLLLDLNPWINRGVAALFVGLFTLLVLNVEKKEFQRITWKFR
jgi:hypothetical protein